jgi:transcription antitermination protein NusB
MTEDTSITEVKLSNRRSARYAAIQTLYQLESDPTLKVEKALTDFVNHRVPEQIEGVSIKAIDKQFFAILVKGVMLKKIDIDDMITAVLVETWSVERLDAVLRAILRAGTLEISELHDVPPKVTINEYTSLCAGFLGHKETSLVNATLDQVAQSLRPEELVNV